jgi:hypothetical protein
VSTERIETLQNYVCTVQKYLAQRDVNVPFFIAGGSVFSLINNNKNYEDIDVYFYCDKDRDHAKAKFEEFSDFTTFNSLNFNGPEDVAAEIIDMSPSPVNGWPAFKEKVKLAMPWSHKAKLQLIIKHTGTPEEIFSTFDFNCSRCAFTSEGELIKDSSYSTVLSFDKESLSRDSIERYRKYIEKKGAKDSNESVLYDIYAYMLEDMDRIFESYYDKSGVPASEIINSEVNRLNQKNEYGKIQYLHNKIVKNYTEERLIEIFTKLKAYHYLKQVKACEQLNLARLLTLDEVYWKSEPKLISPDIAIKLRTKYAEHFI